MQNYSNNIEKNVERRHTLQVERTIDATPTVIWQCWTDPSLFAQWFCPKPWRVTKADFNLRIGGRMNTVMEGPNGERQESHGVWLEICPPSSLVFTDSFTEGFNPVEQPFMTGFVQLKGISHDQTKMIWGASHKSVEDMQQHSDMGFEAGWNAAADQLNKLAVELANSRDFMQRKRRSQPIQRKVRTCLWFDGHIEEAAVFYVSLLENSYIEAISRTVSMDEATVVEFVLNGIPFMILNGGPQYPQSPAVSISVLTEDQSETDRLWQKLLSNGGKESKCGWITDKFGVSWQIVPKKLVEFLSSEDPDLVKRVSNEVLQMGKIDVARVISAANSG